jgi:hypothetical protein
MSCHTVLSEVIFREKNTIAGMSMVLNWFSHTQLLCVPESEHILVRSILNMLQWCQDSTQKLHEHNSDQCLQKWLECVYEVANNYFWRLCSPNFRDCIQLQVQISYVAVRPNFMDLSLPWKASMFSLLKFPRIMEPNILSCSQEIATSPYPKPNECNMYPPTLFS